jgi:prolipoprotein diacylglyceryltransferase
MTLEEQKALDLTKYERQRGLEKLKSIFGWFQLITVTSAAVIVFSKDLNDSSPKTAAVVFLLLAVLFAVIGYGLFVDHYEQVRVRTKSEQRQDQFAIWFTGGSFFVGMVLFICALSHGGK